MITTETKILPSPFPGLRPFKTEETHLFFGREGQIDEVLEKLEENNFIAILGTSGSGKSSLMYCGLIPSLYGGFITQQGSNWKVIVSRPGISPIHNLAEELIKSEVHEELDDVSFQIKKESNLAVLRSTSLGLIELVKNIRQDEDENILIVIDQFEELFRFNRMEANLNTANESSAFVKLLMNAIQQTEIPIYVVITMRSDYIGDCANFPQLTNMINNSHYLIPQMTREQKRAAVLGPVAVGSGTMASRLVQQLLNDLGDKHDQLPILQHALMRTWDYWTKQRKNNEPIDIVHYEFIGGMEEALSLHADEAFEELNKREKDICAILFKALTEKGADGRGIRRPTKLKDIAEITAAHINEIINVVEAFRMVGRTLLMPSPTITLNGDSIIDISHESLMRVWVRCKEWVEEEGESVKMYVRLSEAAGMYQIGKTGLWRSPDLQVALNWKQKQKPNLIWAQRYDPAFERAMVFLESSRVTYEEEERSKERLQKRQVQRAKYTAIIIGLIAIVALFAGIFGSLKADEAEKAKKLTEKSLVEAENARIFAEGETKKAKIEKNAADVARKKALKEEGKAKKAAQESLIEKKRAEAALKEAEKQKILAQKNANEAKKQKDAADLQKELALENEKKAIKAKKEAELNRKEAERLNFLSISNAMAVKSLRINDTTLRTLIAKQAYLFNKNYNKGRSNPDVYEGLYFAKKTLEISDFNTLVGHKDAIRAMAFDKGGKHLYTAGSDGKIFKWDFNNLKRERTLYYQKKDVIFRALEISPDNRWLVVGTNLAGIQLFDLSIPDPKVKLLEEHDEAVWSLQFSPDSKYIYTTGADGKIIKWDLNSLNSSVIAENTKNKIRSLAISKDGNQLVGAMDDGQILMWNLKKENEMEVIYHEKGDIATAIAFSPIESHLVVKGFESGKVYIWDLNKSEKAHELEGHDARISDITFSEDGKYIASSSFDRSVRIWNMINPKQEPIVLNDHQDWVKSIIFTPDDKSLVTGCRDNVVRVFPLDINLLANNICNNIERNLTQKEWNKYIGSNIEYEKTCPDIQAENKDDE